MFTTQREPVHSPRALQAAYNRLYQTRKDWLSRRDSLAHWLLGLIRPRPGATFLDVACGDGTLLAASRWTGLDCYGIDISDQAVRSAHRNLGQRGVIVGDGAMLPFPDNSFDYVTNIGSLEHYLEMERGVREMARVLKPEGLACILLPNAFGLTWSVWHAWRSGDLANDEHQPIQRFATRYAWQALLESNGLKVQRTVGYEQSWPRSVSEKRYYLTHPKELFLLLLAPLIPLNLARCFVFLCTSLF